MSLKVLPTGTTLTHTAQPGSSDRQSAGVYGLSITGMRVFAFADRLLCGLVCALLWCEMVAGGSTLRPTELRALQQLYNVTGGPQGAWLNDTGWRGGGAVDPCAWWSLSAGFD